MSEKLKRHIDKWGLWYISILISLSFASLDGRYLRSYMFAGWLGTICAYLGNFLIDLTSEVLIYEFTRHQRDTIEGKNRKRKKLFSWVLLVGALGLLYFALLFSFRQAQLIKPDEPLIYLWSIAAFAQVTLLLLGAASALRDHPDPKEKASKPKATQPAFACELCTFVGKNQHALNGHMSIHSNGNGSKLDVKRERAILDA